MAAPTHGARKAMVVAGFVAVAYFGALVTLFLLSGASLAFSGDAALFAVILTGGPLSVAIGCLIWRWGLLTAGDLAYRDDLTGLPNRRAFMLDAAKSLKNATAGSVALVLLDLDKLKRLNDSCGHQAGDELIEAAAQQLQRAVAKDAGVYRIGGDEFAIIVNRAKGGRLSGIMRSLKAPDMRFRACQHVHSVAMSHGYASCTEGESFESLFKRADQRLYESKDTSRDDAAAAAGARPPRLRSSAPALGIEAPERRLSLIHSRD